jgi:choline transport protein
MGALGWLTCLGWQAFCASGAFLSAGMIQGLIILTDNSYVPQPWQSMLLFWAVIFFCVFVNTVISSWLPKLESMILVVHILGFFGILLPLLTLGPRAPASQVFGQFINTGGWQTNGLSFMVGLLGNVYTFFGADGPIHMSEEIQNASTVVPRAIVASITLNGAMGFGMCLTLLFVIGDIEKALNTPTGQPFMQIFLGAVQSVSGAAGMSAIVIALAVSSTVGIVASSSRQLWSFSRDRAVPGWRQLEKVHPRTQVPVYSVLVTLVFSVLLSLILLGSSTAFNDIVSLSVVGLFGSYLMVVVLMFYRRVRGDIRPSDSIDDHGLTNIPGAPLVWGPWSMRGVWGTMINGFAIAYLVVIFFFVMWPPVNHPTPATMNYSSVMFGATMIFSVGYYFAYAKIAWTGLVVQNT